jgi:hypothetical protein
MPSRWYELSRVKDVPSVGVGYHVMSVTEDDRPMATSHQLSKHATDSATHLIHGLTKAPRPVLLRPVLGPIPKSIMDLRSDLVDVSLDPVLPPSTTETYTTISQPHHPCSSENFTGAICQ